MKYVYDFAKFKRRDYIPVDYSIETLERPTSHEVSHSFLLNSESLYLIVNVEKE